ncbi:MAG: ribonuclease R [Clostridia bacterium]
MITKKDLLKYMDENTYKPMKFNELVKELEIKNKQEEEFHELLEELISQGEIIKTRYRRYGIPHKMNLVVGRLQGNKAGFAFLISEREKDDTFIAPQNLNGAMHGDKVIARIIPSSHKKKNKEGEIIRIIKRAREEIVGRLDVINNSYGFIVPDHQKIGTDFYIVRKNYNGAKDGDKVVADIIAWPKNNRSPEAKVTEVIGKEGQPGVDTLSVIYEYKLKTDFPDKVINEARRVSAKEITSKDRKDFRDKFTITIDGADARDFDDAITIEKQGDNFILGVHIADVGQYVKKGSVIDEEAFERGTSVYFPDRVLPMLPEVLSNGVCSLNPNVDRYTLSILMEINQEGNILNHQIYEGIINSNRRLTYDIVNKILVDKDEESIKSHQDCLDILNNAGELAKILRAKRKERGSIDFDFAESKVIIDQVNGRPVEIKPRRRRFSDNIIEEFMLAANETIAEHFHWLDIPFMYRVHDEPLPEKINDLEKFLQNFDIYLKGINEGEVHPKELQQAVDQADGRPEEKLINTVILRSMQRAVYSDTCDGHFGLAARFYTHFTSPIRRYPDLVIHRIIKDYLNKELDLTEEDGDLSDFVAEAANQSTACEKKADEAERSIIDLLKVDYMQRHISDVFTGIISGVIPSGFFVELPNTVEGFVHVSSLYDDYYVYEEENYRFLGERTGKTYRIGDEVEVEVIKADIRTRKIDFRLTDFKE